VGAVVCVIAMSLGSCDDEPRASPNGSVEDRLLVAEDLGNTWTEAPARAGAELCVVDIAQPVRSAERSLVSNAAQQAVDQQLLQYGDAEEASSAFADALVESSCEPSEFGEAGGGAATVAVDGADDAFGADFADELDAAAFTVALVGDTIAVVETKLHQAGATAEQVGSDQIVTRLVARIR